MNDKIRNALQMAYDRTCEATSDLSAAGRSGVSGATLDRIRYAYNLSHDLQVAIRGILEQASK